MKMTITPRRAYEMMQDAGIAMSEETIKQGIRQGRWPAWGDYIAPEGSGQEARYYVYLLPFSRWLEARSPYAKAVEVDVV